jgi:hypothetical protein
MSNTELLLKEAERLSPDCFNELLDFARFLSRKSVQSHTPEWQPPPDSDFWEDRVKAGLDPDVWRKSYGAWKDLKFSSEELFAERRLEVERDEAEFHAMLHKEGQAK